MTGVELVGQRVRLREITPADLDKVHSIVGDDRVTQFLSFDARTRDQAQAMLAKFIEHANADPRVEYYLAAVPIGTDEVVGFARLALGGAKAAKLGGAAAFAHQGKGYAVDALRAMLGFAFGPLGLHRVTAAIGPENPASMAVVRQCGFIQEGVLRDHVHTNGAWRDSVLFSRLATD